jgi:hypothetical protein
MDAAILGLVGLGGLYAINSQEKDNKRRRDEKQIQSALPKPESINVSKSNYESEGNSYVSNQKASDKYITQSEFKKKVKFEIPEPSKKDFRYDHMKPFFGGKIKGGGSDFDQSEIVLDNLNGNGSQIITKKEQAPLFRPEENMQWGHGMPNHSDFLQSRVNPSMAMNNVKPFEEERVGPGLGKGFTIDGSGGFNSGMEARNSWLPKNVNELRTLTNPKVTYDLDNHQGPASAVIKERGHLGTVNKNLPDTYYINSPERYLTTTGIQKAQTARGIEELKYQNRLDSTAEYGGVAGRGDKLASKAPENYEPSRFPHTYGEMRGKAHAGAGVQPASDGDYGRLGHKSLPNNRSTVPQREQYGAVGSLIGAVIAPVMDVLRPSRKENVVGNIRLSGNVQKSGGGGEYIYDPNEIAKTTIKETTENSAFHLNVEKSGGGGEYVYDPNDVAKVTMKQTTECSPFHLNVQNQKADAYQVSEQQAIYNQRDSTNYSDYGAAGNSSGLAVVDQYARQRNNNNKIQAPASIHGSTSIYNGEINQRNNNLKACDNPREWGVPSARINATPSVKHQGALHGGQSYNQQKIGTDRINPDLLNAFKSNPYTKSLNSW